jgi:hypothetical protein
MRSFIHIRAAGWEVGTDITHQVMDGVESEEITTETPAATSRPSRPH